MVFTIQLSKLALPIVMAKKTTQIEKVSDNHGPLRTQGKLLFLFLFLGCAFLQYFQTINYEYVLDDALVFTKNNFVKEGPSGIWKILSNETFMGYFGEQKGLVEGSRYRPLSLVSFNLEHQVFGMNPRVSHFFNILIYGLVGYVVFITLIRLFKESNTKKNNFLSLAFLASIIYLLHPLHIEAVANVKGRDELMTMLFSMLAFYYALKYVDSGHIKNIVWMAIHFFLGLLSKENTLTFLAIIPFAIYLFRRTERTRNFKAFGILLLVSIIYLFVRYSVIGFLFGNADSTDLMNNAFAEMAPHEKYATIFYTLLTYVKLHVFPHPLTHDYYPYHIPKMDFGDWQVWLSVIIHLGMVGTIFYYLKKNPIISFALGFYIAAMSIVSNFVVSIGTFMNERFAFVASLGFSILIGLFIKLIGQKIKSESVILKSLPLIIILGAFAIKSYQRIPAWESPYTLNKTGVSVSPNSARANSFMATALFNLYKSEKDPGKKIALLDEATPYARKAVNIHPTYYNANLMKAGIAAETYKYKKNEEALLNSFLEILNVRPDVDYIYQYADYLNGRVDASKMLAFYQKTGEILNKNGKYSHCVKYMQLAQKPFANDATIQQHLNTAYQRAQSGR